MSSAEILTRDEFKIARQKVAGMIEPRMSYQTADDLVLAEKLLDSGIIDIDSLGSLSSLF